MLALERREIVGRLWIVFPILLLGIGYEDFWGGCFLTLSPLRRHRTLKSRGMGCECPALQWKPSQLRCTLAHKAGVGWEFFRIFESISFLHFYIEIVKSNSLTSMWGLHSTLATSQSCHGLGLAFWWTFDSWLLYCQEVPWLKLLVTDISWYEFLRDGAFQTLAIAFV